MALSSTLYKVSLKPGVSQDWIGFWKVSSDRVMASSTYPALVGMHWTSPVIQVSRSSPKVALSMSENGNHCLKKVIPVDSFVTCEAIFAGTEEIEVTWCKARRMAWIGSFVQFNFAQENPASFSGCEIVRCANGRLVFDRLYRLWCRAKRQVNS
jgi:hypothetical protein